MNVTHKKIETVKMDFKDIIRKNLKFCVPDGLSEEDSETAFNRLMERIEKNRF